VTSLGIETSNLLACSAVPQPTPPPRAPIPLYSLFKWEQQTLSPGIKQAKHEDAHFNLEPRFLNMWNFTSTPPSSQCDGEAQ